MLLRDVRLKTQQGTAACLLLTSKHNQSSSLFSSIEEMSANCAGTAEISSTLHACLKESTLSVKHIPILHIHASELLHSSDRHPPHCHPPFFCSRMASALCYLRFVLACVVAPQPLLAIGCSSSTSNHHSYHRSKQHCHHHPPHCQPPFL